jgi:hypothetical protein
VQTLEFYRVVAGFIRPAWPAEKTDTTSTLAASRSAPIEQRSREAEAIDVGIADESPIDDG